MNRETSLLSGHAPETLPASDIAKLCEVLKLSPSTLSEWLDIDVSGISQCRHCETVFAGAGNCCRRAECKSSEYWQHRARETRRTSKAWQQRQAAKREYSREYRREWRALRKKWREAKARAPKLTALQKRVTPLEVMYERRAA